MNLLRTTASILGVVGVFIIFEAGTPQPRSMIDYSMISLGVAFSLTYFLLVVEDSPSGARVSVLFAPIMLGAGISSLYQVATHSFSETAFSCLTVLAIFFILVGIAMVYKVFSTSA